jgi:hypothetical protein
VRVRTMWLQEFSDAVVYFSNDDLLARAVALKAAAPGFRKGDVPRCVCVFGDLCTPFLASPPVPSCCAQWCVQCSLRAGLPTLCCPVPGTSSIFASEFACSPHAVFVLDAMVLCPPLCPCCVPPCRSVPRLSVCPPGGARVSTLDLNSVASQTLAQLLFPHPAPGSTGGGSDGAPVDVAGLVDALCPRPATKFLDVRAGHVTLGSGAGLPPGAPGAVAGGGGPGTGAHRPVRRQVKPPGPGGGKGAGGAGGGGSGEEAASVAELMRGEATAPVVAGGWCARGAWAGGRRLGRLRGVRGVGIAFGCLSV